LKIRFLALVWIILLAAPVYSYSIDLSYLKIDGTTGFFTDYEGSYFLVDAMATWCKPCEDSMPHLEEVYDIAGDQVPLLSLSLDPDYDTLNKVKAFKDRFKAEWEFGLDSTRDFLDKFEVEGYPTLFMFDQSGNEIKRWLGLVSSKTILDELGKYVDIPETGSSFDFRDFTDGLLTSTRFTIFIFIIWGSTLYIAMRLFLGRKQAG
jgi:thiol-disulfide isomerase/thioredoxin